MCLTVIYLMALSISQINAVSNCMTFVSNEFQAAGKNRDVIRDPVPEFDQDVMKNVTNNFGQISVSLASFAPMMTPK
jgi:hypothetical protein